MDKKKSVPTLENKALQRINLIIEESKKELCKSLISISGCYDSPVEEIITFIKARLKDLTELVDVPLNFYEDLSEAKFNLILNVYETIISRTQLLRKEIRNIFDGISHDICYFMFPENSKTAYRLNDNSPELEWIFYKHLKNLKYLEVLEIMGPANLLCKGRFVTKLEVESTIINSVNSFKNLSMLTIYSNGTDAILKAVGDNCKKLKSLNVISSRDVTNKSVSYISQLNLERVIFDITSIDANGFKELLLDCQTLKFMFGETYGMEKILQKVYDSKKKFTLNLVELKIRITNVYYLQLLSKLCPKLRRLTMYWWIKNNDNNDLGSLISLKDLEELIIRSDFSYYVIGMESFLKAAGTKITCLTFTCVHDFDCHALISIGKYCPNIVQLKIILYENKRGRVYEEKMPDNIFSRLERLELHGNGLLMNSILENVLSKCYNLTHLTLHFEELFQESTMHKIVKKNPFSKLQSFIIINCNFSLHILHVMIEQCGNLKYIADFDKWSGIDERERILIKTHVSQNLFNAQSLKELFNVSEL